MVLDQLLGLAPGGPDRDRNGDNIVDAGDI